MTSEDATRAFIPDDPHEKLKTPTQIGAYRIVDVLGQGGMGTVFLAEQTSPVKRQVALKVVKLGMERELILARFHLERQALARMNHPFIATVFDAATHDGNPFFVMEYVDGEPITDYCNRHKLSLNDRLDLFYKVCSAISHAHQRMVIHRDLKPSNILVTYRDNEAIPKIIDFGVARDNTDNEETGLTHAGVPLGTPSYLPPEQIEGNSSDLDARADVFALGVVLYELLAGCKPFDTKQVHRLLMRIQEEDSPPPSERFQSLDSKQLAIAEERQTTPVELVQKLSRELDWIVLKAVARHREERYDSVSSFQSDLRRYKLNHPILAKPRSAGYRARKFIRRHRVGFVASVVVFLVLVLGITGTTVGMIRADRARAEAVKAEKTARITVDYLREILSSADPSVDGRQVKVADMLDKASNMIQKDFEERPEVEAPLRKTLGWTYLELGLYERAEEQLKRCIELQEELLGPDHLETLASINAMGRLHYKLGRYAEAEAIHRRVYEKELEVQGLEHPTTMWTMYNLAKALDKQRKFQEAEQLYRLNVSVRTKALGPKHPHTLISINSLGLMLAGLDRIREAETLLRTNINALKVNMGDEHPNTLNAMANLVKVLNQGKQYSKAQELAEEVEVVQMRVFGANHPETLQTLGQRALAMGHLDLCDKAQAINEGLLKTSKRILGDTHPQTQETRLALASNLCCLERHEEAVEMFRSVLGHSDDVAQADRGRFASYEAAYGTCLAHNARDRNALFWLERAYAYARQHGAVTDALLESMVATYERLEDVGKAEQFRAMLGRQ